MVELPRLPRVKVCGLTRAEDALAALDLGAEALGFVFHEGSPRAADPGDVAALWTLLPARALGVAVVVEAEPLGARALLERTGLAAVQLCGDQEPADWRDFGAPLLRRVGVDAGGAAELERWRGVASGFVLDHPAAAGGTGREVDLELAAQLAGAGPCLLAGGLDGTRVAEAVRRVRPAGVDASSRLECAPGVKDPGALEAFVTSALDTFAELET